MNEELTEEPAPKHVIGVFDPLIPTTYWVFSDFPIPFNEAKYYVSKFMGERAREFDLNYQKVYSLPPEVILIAQKDGRVTARQLPTPDELDKRREIVEKRKEQLRMRHQPKQ